MDIQKVKRTIMDIRGTSQMKRRRINKACTKTNEVTFQDMLENKGIGMLKQLCHATTALQIMHLNPFAWHHIKWMEWFVKRNLRSCCLDFPVDKREEQAGLEIALFDFGEECIEKSNLIDKFFMNWSK
jgi:hypothetical protein